MKQLVKIKFGSHLYGTDTKNSDLDYKGVFIPSARDLILQKAPKQIITNTKSGSDSRNTKDDIDNEMFSLHRFIDLLMDGQTVALDMFFAGSDNWENNKCDWTWFRLKNSGNRLISAKATSFIGYCNTQAAKYGIKGSRISSLTGITNLLKSKGANVKLSSFWNEIEAYVNSDEHSSIELLQGPNKESVPHLQVCNKKVAMFNTVKQALPIYENVLARYGDRAKEAQNNENIDWKALHHAVRVCYEAEELLTTGSITFPRPDKDILIKIKKGELPYNQVAELIEAGMDRIKELEKKSFLRAEPDRAWAEEFIYEIYKEHIIESR